MTDKKSNFVVTHQKSITLSSSQIKTILARAFGIESLNIQLYDGYSSSYCEDLILKWEETSSLVFDDKKPPS
jgi:ribosomal protein S24E